MEIREITVYTFEELEEAAQATALSRLSDINVDGQWWEFLYEEFKEELKSKGLTCDKFYFSIGGQGQYISANKLSVSDRKLLLAWSEVRTHGRLEDEFDPEFITQGRNNTFRSVSQYGHTGYTRIDKKLDEVCSALTDKIQSLLEDFLIRLNREYDGLTSEEAIKESIKANDYRFTANGRLF